MLTLRELVRNDRALASISTEECHLLAQVIEHFAVLTSHWFFKRFIPKYLRDKNLSLRMLAATLNRTQSEPAPSLERQIRIAMAEDHERPDRIPSK